MENYSTNKICFLYFFTAGFDFCRKIRKMKSSKTALSPLLFNVYTVENTSNQLEGPSQTLSVADDVLMYRQGKNRNDIANSVQEELTALEIVKRNMVNFTQVKPLELTQQSRCTSRPLSTVSVEGNLVGSPSRD